MVCALSGHKLINILRVIFMYGLQTSMVHAGVLEDWTCDIVLIILLLATAPDYLLKFSTRRNVVGRKYRDTENTRRYNGITLFLLAVRLGCTHTRRLWTLPIRWK